MVQGKWAAKIAKTKKAEHEQPAVDSEHLMEFIGAATADTGTTGKILEDEVSLFEKTDKPSSVVALAQKKNKVEKKDKRPQGRPSSGIETIKKQFDFPVVLANKLVILANKKYTGNQTKALWAVLEGKDRL